MSLVLQFRTDVATDVANRSGPDTRFTGADAHEELPVPDKLARASDVVDTGLALRAALADVEAVLDVPDDLVAPPLLWSEARSALHEARWRGEIAELLSCRFVTIDARLRRGADRLGFVVGPTELYVNASPPRQTLLDACTCSRRAGSWTS